MFVQVKKNKTAASAKAFLGAVHKVCPMRIQKVLTDNYGKEFTDRLSASSARPPTGEHEFDQLLEIEHRLTKPRTPRTNGMVKRFNGPIADVLRSHRFQSGLDLEQRLLRYMALYKHQFPQSALKSRTPIQAMKNWYAERPDFLSSVPMIIRDAKNIFSTMKTIDKAKIAISRITAGEKISEVRQEISNNEDNWFRVSAKAYSIHLQTARKQRKADAKKRNLAATSNEEIGKILDLNDKLATYALCLPTLATKSDMERVSSLLTGMPQTEIQLLLLIEGMTLEPRIRALQNIGRIRQFAAFKEFSSFVEAATLCYYRGNFASAYLTLVPVIEGIILRWSGYQGIGEKPEFEEIRKFFGIPHVRQPCPGNPLFHDVFCRACNKIVNDHLYQPSQRGTAYSEFNRHQASHLLRNTEFATKGNCIRMFLLLDTMAEVYLYETYCRDPRWSLTNQDTRREVTLYKALQLETANGNTPENVLLCGGPLVR